MTAPFLFEEEVDIPLSISDLLVICKEFNNLGWQIQQQVECILEIGIEEAIKTGVIKQVAIPHIKNFLKAICNNAYFGDATMQAQECIHIISTYQEVNKNSN